MHSSREFTRRMLTSEKQFVVPDGFGNRVVVGGRVSGRDMSISATGVLVSTLFVENRKVIIREREREREKGFEDEMKV